MITGRYPSLRLRRNRKYSWTRRLLRENNLSADDLILPIFLTEGKNKKIKISAMPGVYRYSIDMLPKVIDKTLKNKIPMIAFFPNTPSNKKNSLGTESLNEDNLVCRAIKFTKKKYKNEIGVMTDVALDPYTSHGHDGLLKDKNILNDETIKVLVEQSLLQAQMGCDVLAPSDMMDGRIGKIRKALDKNNFYNVQLLSYAVKFASNFYGPFRNALDSTPGFGDKSTYQMDYANSKDALKIKKLSKQKDVDVLVGHHRRHNPIIKRAYDIINKSVIVHRKTLTSSVTWYRNPCLNLCPAYQWQASQDQVHTGQLLEESDPTPIKLI